MHVNIYSYIVYASSYIVYTCKYILYIHLDIYSYTVYTNSDITVVYCAKARPILILPAYAMFGYISIRILCRPSTLSHQALGILVDWLISSGVLTRIATIVGEDASSKVSIYECISVEFQWVMLEAKFLTIYTQRIFFRNLI